MKLQFTLFVFVCVVTEIWTCSSCGISSGGPMVQVVSKKFEWINGLHWKVKAEVLVFVDRVNNSIDGYHISSGRINTIEIEELKGQQLVAIYPIKQKPKDEEDGKFKYVIAGNQSLYKFEGKLYEPYTLEKIMDITDDSKFLCEAAIDKNGHIVIGATPSDFKLGDDDFKKGSAEYYYVNVADKSKKVIDNGQDIAAGVCFNKYYTKMYTVDFYKNKIYSFKYNVANGETSDKKEIFDLIQYNDTMKAHIYGHMISIVMDSEENLWIGLLHSHEIATYLNLLIGVKLMLPGNTMQILVYNPFNQKIIKRIGVPGSFHTSLAWGGEKFDILFVGTAKQQQGGAGSLIAISNTGHRGWPLYQIKV